ncbi:MAG: M28 family peptidase [Isosphaeraceae bacterium]
MQRIAFSGLLAAAALLTAGTTTGSGQDESPAQRSPIGFSPASAAAYRKVEGQALAVPTPENARSWLRTLTEEPHPAGSRADYKTALFVRDKLREWGWKAELAEYEVLLNYPKSSSLTLQRPEPKELSLVEAPNPADKDSASPDAFPAFHGYGISGTATGQVVYANYGQPEDFAALEKMGIEVKDKIVLVRYGAIFRGLKVRNAQKRGARGVLIYSDPADDGYARGDIYPSGPFRPGSALQRGSVQFLSLGPGDPSTPNGPSTRGAKRLAWDPQHGFPIANDPWSTVGPDGQRFKRKSPPTDGGEAGPLLKVPTVEEWEKESGFKREDYFATIPSLPISYDSARPILEALGGPNVPQGWQGCLPIPYHVGPGPAEVQFSVEMEYALRPVWNVIATIQGSVEPDRWVIVGNHRDAWVYGAVDPSSGTAATLEACRAIGTAVKNGWKPRRTLVYASWDAEEYGLVGSTEWCDENAKELDAKAALLLNVDSAVAGPDLDIDGVPSLRDLVLDACSAVTDVRSGKNLRDVWVEKPPVRLGGLDPHRLLRPALGREPRGDAGGRAERPQSRLGVGRDPRARLARAVLPAAQPAGVGVGLHGVPRPPGRARARRRVRGKVRGLSLDLRRLLLDGTVLRPRVPHPRHGGKALHGDRHACGRRGRLAAAVHPLRRGVA